MIKSQTILEDPIESFYWAEVVPLITDLLSSRPVEFSSETGISTWRTRDFVKYHQTKYESQFGFRPQIVNQIKIDNQFKNKVFDYFYSQVNQEIKNFIDWALASRSSKEAKIEFLPYLINDYMSEKVSQKFRLASHDPQEDDLSKLSIDSALQYYGTGVNDDSLTKDEFFVGMSWRRENLTPGAICEIEEWQKKNYKHNFDLLEKLKRWREEFETYKSFNTLREFFALESRKKQQTVGEVLKYYKVPKYRGLFSTEELDKIVLQRW